MTNERNLQASGLALIRIVVGVVFVAHGLQKLLVFGPTTELPQFMAQIGLPFPTASAILLTAVELLGGAALVLGAFARWAAALLAVTMAVATVTVHVPAGFFLPNGYEYTLTLLAATLGLAIAGPGALALDRAIFAAVRADGRDSAPARKVA